MEIWRCVGALFFFIAIVHANSDPHENDEDRFNDAEHVPGEPLSPQDYEKAETLNMTTPQDGNRDPIEIAGLYEGDIKLNTRSSDKREQNNDTKNAVNRDTLKWKNAIVPYFISAQFSDKERSVIARAFLEYERQTCIRFKPRTEEEDYIHITKGQGCSSPVGRSGGAQQVILGEGCIFPGIAIHELMHAIGFWHEQSRWDRDDFVTVYYQNIATGMEFNFKKYSWKDIQNLTAQYDTYSIMHYGPYAFSKDRKQPTILPKNPNSKMGQRNNFSSTDVFKIRRLYECDNQTEEVPPPPVTNSAGQSECVDSHKFCPDWAAQGECKKNPNWMLVNCKKSCNQCGSPCSDANKHCGSWAEKGECSKNPDYMHTYCAKSCGTCANDSGDTYASSTVCEDKSKNCAYWASHDECKKNPNYMLKSCAKSCNSCKKD